MSMSYLYEVIGHLLRLWMGIWLHTHTVTTTDISPDLWELGEILPNASEQTMPLRFGWECRTFQTASPCPCDTYMRCLSTFSVYGWDMASHSHQYRHRHFPRFGRVGWNPTWCKCANNATTLWLRLQNLSICIPCPCDTYMRGLSTFLGCGWAYGFTLTPLPPQMFPLIWRVWLKSYLMQVCKPCHYILTEAVEPFKLHPMSILYIWGVWAPSQVVEWHMASHSHRYPHSHFPRFGKVCWNTTWYKCANHATKLRLRLQNLSNCIPHPCDAYMRGLSTISGCRWA